MLCDTPLAFRIVDFLIDQPSDERLQVCRLAADWSYSDALPTAATRVWLGEMLGVEILDGKRAAKVFATVMAHEMDLGSSFGNHWHSCRNRGHRVLRRPDPFAT